MVGTSGRGAEQRLRGRKSSFGVLLLRLLAVHVDGQCANLLSWFVVLLFVVACVVSEVSKALALSLNRAALWDREFFCSVALLQKDFFPPTLNTSQQAEVLQCCRLYGLHAGIWRLLFSAGGEKVK